MTLADLVADVRALTPSEAAELVVPSHEELLAELDRHQRRLAASLRARAAEARGRLEVLGSSIVFRRPEARLHDLARRLDELGQRAERAVGNRLQQCRNLWEARAAQLESLSPLAILGRGYSLTRRSADGAAIRAADMLAPGDEIITRFARGQATSVVKQLEPDS